MKKVLSLLLVSVLLLGLVACGSPKTAPAATTKAGTPSETKKVAEATKAGAATAAGAKSPDNDMVVALQADVTNMDPHIGSNGVSNLILNTMYETLVSFNEKTEVVPALAKSYKVSADGLSYTFVLNEGVKFHDGEAFNAAAVKANWERGKSNEKLRIASTIKTLAWEDTIVDSEYQVTIKLSKANNTFVNKIAQFRLVSPKAIKDFGQDGFTKASAGTGPFKFDSRQEGGFTKMVRNKDYWREGPKVDTLTFKVVPEDGARIAMLQTGEADIIYPLPPVQVAKVENNKDIVVNNFAGITYRYATLNQNYKLADGKMPFKEVKVRQAMNYAFDSQAYSKVVFKGFALEPTSIFSKSIMYYSEQKPYTKDLAKAKKLMEEAGFKDGFPVEIWVDNTTIEMQGAEFFKQQMAEIKIDVKVTPMESTKIAELTSANPEENKVQIWYVNWGSGSYEADGSMRSILHGEKFPPKGYNTAFYNNPTFNKLLDEALLLSDTKEIAAKYAEAQKIAWDECPWVFLGNDNTINAQRVYVKGVMYKPGGDIVFTKAELVR